MTNIPKSETLYGDVCALNPRRHVRKRHVKNDDATNNKYKQNIRHNNTVAEFNDGRACQRITIWYNRPHWTDA